MMHCITWAPPKPTSNFPPTTTTNKYNNNNNKHNYTKSDQQIQRFPSFSLAPHRTAKHTTPPETANAAATRGWLGTGAIRSTAQPYRRSDHRIRPQNTAFPGTGLHSRPHQPGQHSSQPRGAQSSHRAVHFGARSHSQQGRQRDPPQQWVAQCQRMCGHHNGCAQHGPSAATTAQHGVRAHGSSPSFLHLAEILEKMRASPPDN